MAAAVSRRHVERLRVHLVVLDALGPNRLEGAVADVQRHLGAPDAAAAS